MSGVGKLWHHVLDHLAETVRLEYVEAPGARGRLRGRWERRPDVWLSDGHEGPLEVGEPRVVELHEASWHLPETRPFLEPWFIEAFEEPSRRAATTATRIITLSESSRGQLIDAYGLDPAIVHAVHLGVDPEVFRPGLAGGSEIVASAGGTRGAPYVLFVGQLHPRKNLDALRDALAALAERGFPHQLAIVGAGAVDRADWQALQAAASDDLPGAPGRVIRVSDLGEPELAALMAGCAAFCLPSFMEGFGLPVLEAMACGAPVVVSDRGALPEVVGDAGLVVPPVAEALEGALARVLEDSDRASALGSAAVARASEFRWERTARGWLAALEQAAQAATRGLL